MWKVLFHGDSGPLCGPLSCCDRLWLRTGLFVQIHSNTFVCYNFYFSFFQANLPMKRYKYFDLTSQVQDIDAFPIFWIDTSLDLDEENAKMFKYSVKVAHIGGFHLHSGSFSSSFTF